MPLRYNLLVILAAILLFFACKSAPSSVQEAQSVTAPAVQEPEDFPPAEEGPEISWPAGEDEYDAPEVSVQDLPPELTAELPAREEEQEHTGTTQLEEPKADFPETVVPLEEPPDAGALTDLPAPLPPPQVRAAPQVPEAPAPVSGASEAPLSQEPLPVAPAAPGPVTDSVTEPPPPEPPFFIKPLEPEIPLPSREPLQVPVNPLPDLPARPQPGQEEKIVFSRTVRAAVGQLVEIPFRGTGWVYLGELGLPRGIAYDSRRLDPEGQTFIFKVEAAGTYALKFYKQDFIRDYILNDYVQVIAVETAAAGAGWFTPPADQGRVTAEPRWPLLENPPQPSEAPPPESPPLPAPVGPAAVPEPEETPVSPAPDPVPTRTLTDSSLEPGEYVRRAREEYNAGRVIEALSILDRMQSDYPSLTDEALWLYGQFLESNSPGRDIRLGLEYYRRLIREYPQSPLVPQARRRIAYLERYYFNIQ
ncbi:MAG: hypothetical protein LBS48_02260 [Treponema sp.]|nr:hypothetical protein [Treponema sp.]